MCTITLSSLFVFLDLIGQKIKKALHWKTGSALLCWEKKLHVWHQKHQYYYLGLHYPAGDGGLAIVTRFKLQGHGTWADIGDGDIGRWPRHFCKNREKKSRTVWYLKMSTHNKPIMGILLKKKNPHLFNKSHTNTLYGQMCVNTWP